MLLQSAHPGFGKGIVRVTSPFEHTRTSPMRRASIGKIALIACVCLTCALANVRSAVAAVHRADLLIQNALIYDGSGADPYRGELAVTDGDIVAVGVNVTGYEGREVLDARGLAVSPGFINVLSGAEESLIEDGRGLSDVMQGVTLEIFGEGQSYGPLSAASRAELLKSQGDVRYQVTWNTLGEFLDFLVRKGVSPNIASFVGATTVRTHELGYSSRAPTPVDLERMREEVRLAMREGALGVGSALIYAPGAYARTDELVALASAAAESGGGYISHIRNESDRLLDAINEFLAVTRAARSHGEIEHLKAEGRKNWPKMAEAIAVIDAARSAGLPVTANMYPYVAGAAGLDASMPPWVQEGGIDAWVARLQDPHIRARVLDEMRKSSADWESLYLAAGSPDRVVLIGFRSEKLKPLTGKTLSEVAALRGVSPEDAAIDLVIEDHSRVGTAYFHMSEPNVKLGLSQPWVSIVSDEGALAPEGVFLKSSNHPRAYGSFARFLGKYVRDEHVTMLSDAIRRITRLPAENWKLRGRGCLAPGCRADIVIFDPRKISDHATFAAPRLLATGVVHVFVNGVQVIKNGRHTGATPGEVVRGPGWTGWAGRAR
ncbi:MAG TPA: amidohydrolase family protein [Steroidobacteraceae bacterium]|nr:amidohydrolase family protein [Steroidobacteraceae bacterium]